MSFSEAMNAKVVSLVDEVERLRADNARLRALIADKEYTHCGGETEEGEGYSESYGACPWCGKDGHGPDRNDDCPAFSAPGVVR